MRLLLARCGGRHAGARRSARALPARGSALDVAFVLDLTGSMGSWIDQCKTHVASILACCAGPRRRRGPHRLRRLPRPGQRGALGGGWPARRPPRLRARVGEVSALIAAEPATGGDEDVISAMEAARDLSWRGDMRVAFSSPTRPPRLQRLELRDDFLGAVP